MKDKLTLLGIWNIAPLDVSFWFNNNASTQLERLTGIYVRPFTFFQNELQHEYMTTEDLDSLKERLEAEEDKLGYVNKIYDDFYKLYPQLEEFINEHEGIEFSSLSNEDLAKKVTIFEEVWSNVTMHIWYAVFLDLWYPSQNEMLDIKKIAGEARDKTGHIHALSDKVFAVLFGEVSKRLNVDLLDVEHMHVREIVKALDENSVNKEMLESRKTLTVTASLDRDYRAFEGVEAQKLMEEFNPPVAGTEVLKELKGTPANKGSVTGKVRVVTKRAEFETFEEGEVLVALQTMVDYLPVMKKSVAILTEFGGLTSHAAIVSRELGVPAVVGIPNLIASVKNGDTVEIDAGAGIVKVLK